MGYLSALFNGVHRERLPCFFLGELWNLGADASEALLRVKPRRRQRPGSWKVRKIAAKQ